MAGPISNNGREGRGRAPQSPQDQAQQQNNEELVDTLLTRASLAPQTPVANKQTNPALNAENEPILGLDRETKDKKEAGPGRAEVQEKFVPGAQTYAVDPEQLKSAAKEAAGISSKGGSQAWNRLEQPRDLKDCVEMSLLNAKLLMARAMQAASSLGEVPSLSPSGETRVISPETQQFMKFRAGLKTASLERKVEEKGAGLILAN
jgi:hypothetical protein